MKNNIKWKITVSCMTFNQAAYITDAMNGFVMQKTNFPYVCTIVDDASTDGEQTVIREYVEKNFDFSDKTIAYTQETDYAHIMFAQHKENKNCYFAVLFLKENHYSIKRSKFPYLKPWREGIEYLAICEGDDCWIDSNKLQMQADILDANENVVMSHTNFAFFYQNNGTSYCDEKQNAINLQLSLKQNEIISEILKFNHYRIQTNTVLLRMSTYLKCYEDISKICNLFLMSDTLLWCYMKRHGDFSYSEENTAIYRINLGSVTHSSNPIKKFRFHLSCAEMRYFLFYEFDLNNNKLHQQLKSDYKLRLLIYKSFCNDYSPFVQINWNNKFEKVIYYAMFNQMCYFVIRSIVNTYLFFRRK